MLLINDCRNQDYCTYLNTCYPAWRKPASFIVSGWPSPNIPTSTTSTMITVESPASSVWRTSQATQASASRNTGQPFDPGMYATPASLSGCCMADFPSLPASSRWPERCTFTVNLRLRRIMGRDFESFSTEMASNGGSKDACVSQLAVKMLTSPSSAHDTAYRPYVNVRSTCFLIAPSMLVLLLICLHSWHVWDFHRNCRKTSLSIVTVEKVPREGLERGLPENTDSCLISHRLQTVPLFVENRYAFIRKHTVLTGTQ